MTNPDNEATRLPSGVGDVDATLPPSQVNDPNSTLALPGTSATQRGDSRAPDGYVIEKELGRGGMGVVYLARDVKLNRRCALKMILSGAHSGSAEIDRFQLEAQAIARLQHPGIVQVFEIGEHDGKPFMALEYCDSGSLDSKLRRNPLKPIDAAKVVRQLARAMQAAHDANIIHRDLKPANVMLTTISGPSGKAITPKITDFGLAKKLDEDGATRTGSVMGTPSYMSPEQAGGDKHIGPPADIYALGAILYECLSGRPPFRAATPLDTLLQVISEEPVNLRQLNAKVPIDLETITHKCLQKDPAKRYPSAQELADDLQRFVRGEPVLARLPGRAERLVRWIRRHPWTAAQLGGVFGLMLLTTVVATTSAVRINKAQQDTLAALGNAEEARSRESDALLQSRRQITRLDLLQANRFADNRQFDEALLTLGTAWQSDADEENEATHRLRMGLVLQTRVRLVGLGIHDTPLIDAIADRTGSRVLTQTTNGQAGLWDIRAGRAIQIRLPHGSIIHSIAMSDDGRFALTGGENGQIAVWETNTGQLKRRLEHGSKVSCVAFQPGGSTFAVAGGPKLTFWKADDGRLARESIDAPGCYFVGFDRSGARFVTANDAAFARVWDFGTGQPVGRPVAHAPRTPLQQFENIRRGPVLTPDGQRLLTSTGTYPQKTYSLTCTDVMTGNVLWQTPYGVSGVNWQSFSPDGQRMTGSHSKSHLREIATGRLLANFDTPRESQFATFLGDNLVAAVSTGGLVQFWNAVEPYNLTDWKIQAAEGVRSMSALPDGKHLLIACGDGTARLYRLPETPPVDPNFGGRANRRRGYPIRDNRQSTLSPDGQLECLFLRGHPAHFGPRGQANLPFVIDAQVNLARFSDDGQAIVTQNDLGMRVWAVATAQPIGPEVAKDGANQFSLSRDARRVALANATTRTVKVVDMTTGRTLLRRTFPPSIEPTSGYLTLDAAGQRVAFTDFAYGGAVEIWDIDRQARLHSLNPHRGFINHLQLSSDGNILLVCSSDTTARLWDMTTGQPLGPVLRHSAFCRHGAIAEDGRFVATADGNGVIQLWDARKGDRLGIWGPFEKGFPRVVDGIVFDAAGNPVEYHVLKRPPRRRLPCGPRVRPRPGGRRAALVPLPTGRVRRGACPTSCRHFRCSPNSDASRWL
jgi:WD40 repeat protein